MLKPCDKGLFASGIRLVAIVNSVLPTTQLARARNIRIVVPNSDLGMDKVTYAIGSVRIDFQGFP